MQGQKNEPQNLTDGLVRSLKARLAAEEGNPASPVVAPVNAKPRLFAAAPTAADASVVMAPTSEDLADISMSSLLDRIVANYNSPKTQQVARDAFSELQARLKQDNQIFGAVQIHRKLQDFYHYDNRDTKSSKTQLWLTIISPQVKLCLDLLKASKNILNPNWHNKGTGTLGFTGRTPDTIKDCRALITDSKLLNDSYFDPNFKDDKFVFTVKAAEKLMRDLHDRVSLQSDKKYDELKALLYSPSSIAKAPKDFDECLALFEPHYPQIQYM